MDENKVFDRFSKMLAQNRAHASQCVRQISNTLNKRTICLQEAGKDDLKNAVAKLPIPNKDIVTISGLSAIRADIFMAKCNKIKQNLLVGTDYSTKLPQIAFADGLLNASDKQEIGEALIYAQCCSTDISQQAIAQNLSYLNVAEFVSEMALPEDDGPFDLRSYLARCTRIAISVIPNMIAGTLDRDNPIYNDLQQCSAELAAAGVNSQATKEIVSNLTFTTIEHSLVKEEERTR